MATRVSSARFVGRAAELAQLRDALAGAVDGRPALAFVAGESGVGKTRLVCELERSARADGVRVLSGECVDLGEGELAYAPIVGALRPLAREGDPALDGLPALESILPGLGSGTVARGFSEEAAGARARLFESLLTLIDRLGAENGLLLVIEDLHWADRSTRAFLTYLAASLVTERVLVVATYRADELHRRHPLRPVLAELERTARRIELAPFTQRELAEQLEDILGSQPEPGLVERLYARSEGNALYAEELVAAGTDGRGALPPTLREALMLRVERLEPATQEVLRYLAIAGRLSHGTLEQLQLPALRDSLRDGVAAGIVKTDTEGRYGLRHALLAEVIADDLLPGERAELHLALARVKEAHEGAHNASAVAHHYAAAGDQPAALEWAVRAAVAAEQVHAYGEAAALYERALELWDRVPDAATVAGTDHVELLRAAASSAADAGDTPRSEALLHAAAAELDEEAEPRRLAVVLERLARMQWRNGDTEGANVSQDRALALLPADEPTPERAIVLAGRAKDLMLASRYREAVEVGREALAMAEATDAVLAQIRALDALGVSETWQGEECGVDHVRRGIALAREHGLAITALMLYTNLSDVLLLAGRVAEARATVEEGLALQSELGYFDSWLTLMKADIAFTAGDWQTVREILAQQRRLSPRGWVNEAHRRIPLALADGDHELARELLERCEPLLESSREPQFIGPQAAMRAELLRRAGDLDGARRAVDEGLDRIEFCSEDHVRISSLSLAGLSIEADAAVRARDLGDAEAERAAVFAAELLLARLEACATDGRVVEQANLEAGRALMARARGDDDPAAWAAAVAAWETSSRPYEAAQARWGEAQARLAAGDREGAAEAARAALAGARELGAPWLAAEVEGFLTRARLGPERGPDRDEDPFGLTPRERQVLELLSAGATNKEIGAALYMAEKTASVHVSRILAKLDVRTRTEAAAVAHRLGLT